MNSLTQRLGQTIRQYRLAAKLSQEELAARSGLHRTYVSMVERGVRNITVTALSDIGAVMEVPASRLLADAEAALDPQRSDHTSCTRVS